MRLTLWEREIIINTVKKVLPDFGRVILFGSRADDRKRGGDIDLLIDTAGLITSTAYKIRIQALLQEELGEQKIDLILSSDPYNDTRLVVNEAMKTGVQL